MKLHFRFPARGNLVCHDTQYGANRGGFSDSHVCRGLNSRSLRWTRGCPASSKSARCKQEHGHLRRSTIPSPASTRTTSPRLANHIPSSSSSSFPIVGWTSEGKLVVSQEEIDGRRERNRRPRALIWVQNALRVSISIYLSICKLHIWCVKMRPVLMICVISSL